MATRATKPKTTAKKQTSPARRTKITTRAITPDDWPIIERLFGSNGACGGCWCMTWRVPKGGKLWDEVKGENNRRSFRKLVQDGDATGCLAFAGEEAVGWCSVGPRADFLRMANMKGLQTDWTPKTWSVTCFFIRTPWRRKGIGTALLAEAVKLAKAEGASELEGYPIKPYTENVPGPFAWTGIPKLFTAQKFVEITPSKNSRPIYRKTFRSIRSAK